MDVSDAMLAVTYVKGNKGSQMGNTKKIFKTPPQKNLHNNNKNLGTKDWVFYFFA
jgi:hypothetical protein